MNLSSCQIVVRIASIYTVIALQRKGALVFRASEGASFVLKQYNPTMTVEEKPTPIQIGDKVAIDKGPARKFTVLKKNKSRVIVSDNLTKKKNIPLRNVMPWSEIDVNFKHKKSINLETVKSKKGERLERIVENIRDNLKYYPKDIREKLETQEDNTAITTLAKAARRLGLERKPPSIWDLDLGGEARKILRLQRPTISIDKSSIAKRSPDYYLPKTIEFPDDWEKTERGYRKTTKSDAIKLFESQGWKAKLLHEAHIARRSLKKVYFVSCGWYGNWDDDQSKVEIMEITSSKQLEEDYSRDVPPGIFYVQE